MGRSGFAGNGGWIVRICGFQAAFVQLYRQPEKQLAGFYKK